jgi:hypothetical protein
LSDIPMLAPDECLPPLDATGVGRLERGGDRARPFLIATDPVAVRDWLASTARPDRQEALMRALEALATQTRPSSTDGM